MITFKKEDIRVKQVKLDFIPWEEARDRNIRYESDNNIFCISTGYSILSVSVMMTKKGIFNYSSNTYTDQNFVVRMVARDSRSIFPFVYPMTEDGYNEACKKVETEWNNILLSFNEATIRTDYKIDYSI